MNKSPDNLSIIALHILNGDIGVFPKWSRTFIDFSEFNEFRESDESLKHELGSV